MDEDIRLSVPAARVLREFLEDPDAPCYGFDLMERVGMASGSLYPILARLERAGWIVGAKEDIDPQVEGRPARRYFTLTGEGVRVAQRRLAELSAELRPPVVRSRGRIQIQGGSA
jgi:PadR family transcriptional regulator, regulatory protein PadR